MEKKFGLLLVLVLVSVLVLKFQELSTVAVLLLSFLSSLILSISLLRPKILKPFSVLWLELGAILGKIIQPFIILVIFVVVFVPLGIFFRILNKNLLDLKSSLNQVSYWKERKKINIENMIYQF